MQAAGGESALINSGDLMSHPVLDMFQEVPVDRSIIDGHRRLYRQSIPSKQGPHTLILEKESGSYTLLHTMRLQGKFRVLHSDGTALEEDENVSIATLAPHSLFSRIEVQVENVTQPLLSANHVSAVNWWETMLTTNYTNETTTLKGSAMHVPDDPAHIDSTLLEDTVVSGQVTKKSNRGYVKRASYIAKSKRNEFSIALRFPLATILKAWPDVASLTFIFHRNPPNVLLHKDKANAKEYIIDVEDLALSVHKVLLNPTLYSNHQKALASGANYCLPFTNMDTKVSIVPGGQSEMIWNNIYLGKLPHTMLFFMTKATNYSGTYDMNCHNYPHFNLQGAYIVVNGRIMPHGEGYELDFTEDKESFAVAYRALHDLCSSYTWDTTEGQSIISPQRYTKNGFALAFSTQADGNTNIWDSAHRYGTLELRLKFRVPLPEAVAVHIYALFADVCYVARNGATTYKSEGGSKRSSKK